jgi:hypothetical protein
MLLVELSTIFIAIAACRFFYTYGKRMEQMERLKRLNALKKMLSTGE